MKQIALSRIFPISFTLPPFNQIWLPVVFISIAIFAFLGYFYYEKKRREALKEASRRVSFSYSAKATPGFLDQMLGIDLFNRGHAHVATSIMQGLYDKFSWIIFDYRYTTGYGRNSQTHYQTIAFSKQDKNILPHFTLGPEHFFHKIGSVFGFKDINFKTHEKFSKNYRLKGSDEPSIRNIFTPYVLSALEQKEKPVNLEANQNKFIYFAPGRIKPNNLGAFLESATQILRLLTTSNNI